MDAAVLADARRAIEGLRSAEAAATPGPWREAYADSNKGWIFQGSGPLPVVAAFHRDPLLDIPAIVALRNAAPALLALAEAVGWLTDDDDEWWYYREPGWDESTPSCIACGPLNWRAGELNAGHAANCPALAINAALADIAALAPKEA